MKNLSDIQKAFDSNSWPTRSDAVRDAQQLPTAEALVIFEKAMQDTEKYVRQKAIEMMSELKMPTYKNLLLSALGDDYYYNRELAFAALVKIYNPDLQPILAEAIDRPEEQMKSRMAMLFQLKELTDPNFVPLIKKWLPKIDTKNDSYIFTVFELVKAFPNEQFIPEIINYTKNENFSPSAKSWIVEILGILKATEGIDFVLTHTGHAFSPDNYSDNTCLKALVNMDAAALFLSKLEKYEGRKKNLLIEAIGLLKYQAAEKNFLGGFREIKNIDERYALAQALCNLGFESDNEDEKLLLCIAAKVWDEKWRGGKTIQDHVNQLKTIVEKWATDNNCLPTAANGLLAELVKSYRHILSKVALVYLGETGAATEIDALIAAVKSKDDYKRILAIEALGKIGNAAAASALVAYLFSDGQNEPAYDAGREKAIRSLGQIKEESTFLKLMDLLDDKSKIGRNARSLILVLGDWGNAAACPKILPYLSNNDPYTRAAALKALEQLHWKPNNIEEQILQLSAAQQWDEITKIGSPAIDSLISLTRKKAWDYEKLMLALAKIGEEKTLDYILGWLFEPHFTLFQNTQVLALMPYMQPLFGNLAQPLLEASSFIDVVVTESGRITEYAYSLETALAATLLLKKEKSPLALKILSYIPKKQAVSLNESDHEDYGGAYFKFTFDEQLKYIAE